MKFTLSTLSLAALAALPVELVSAGFAASCSWSWQDPKYVVATCTKRDGTPWRTRQDMNLCVGVNIWSGALISANVGNAWAGSNNCHNTHKDGSTNIKSTCWDWYEGDVTTSLNIGE
ncbi:hypothetical protein QBC41DRAFT_359399 [Cercophora samala]|uniref:Cyanovirin-N domain-containing protein n=1 Tax=Cercophora samala TaxID=330535 RepID=A0AA40D530_9PEZI|nr:hypothetical protein QBC41DRAFT_359399 [Cercophora samala]